MTNATIDTLDAVRAELARLQCDWWATYVAGDRQRADELKRQKKELMDSAIERFAKPEVAGCRTCEENSILGGPRHRPSQFCESGREPHCTCGTCF